MPFLQRGERVDVGDVGRAAGHGGGDLVDLGLGQIDQRQHVRGDVPRTRRDQVRRHLHRRLRRPPRPAPPASAREQRLHRHRHPAHPQTLHQRHGQQRMPAQREEVVIAPPPSRHQGPRRTPGTAAPPAHHPAPGAAAATTASGAGSALRSSLPFAVNGNASSTTTERHHVLRKPRGTCPRTAAATRRPRDRRPAPGDPGRHSHQPHVPWDAAGPPRPPAPRRACAASTACTSPGSTRNPRIFTWSSARPGEHQLPIGRPPRPVPGPIHPATGAERTRHEPLRRQTRPTHITARQL